MTASALVLMAGGIPALAGQVDHRIEAAARNSYNFKVVLHEDGIKVDSVNGMVTLSGSVAVDFHRALAEETVSDLPGVRGVDNQIVIAGAQPVAASDDWITMKVKSTLAFHKNVSALDTDVHTSVGIVTLTGHANTGAERDLAGEYAKDVDGVMDVHNDIAVRGAPVHHHETLGEKIDDSSITAQIKTTLLFHKSVRTLSTKVITKDGVVSLHGQARTEAEKEKVTRLAEDIKGVKHVNNHMTVASL
jgi:osmotically-inducible protein OsmY